MALSLEDKKAIVTEVSNVAGASVSAVTADYRGLTVSEMTELRSNARSQGVYLRVVRNTLAKRALQGTDFECLNDKLSGPVILAFSKDEPSGAARLIRDFSKGHNNLEVKALAVGGKFYEASSLDAVAKLPNKEEAISQLMSVMIAPITKFVRTLAEPHTKLVRTFAAVADKKKAEQ
jgi:large subunit ribosomal protein L10